MIYAFVFVIISLASFIFVMLGLGGAMVYVPVLKWAGFSVKDVAIPLGLLLNGLTTLLALPAYARNKLVDWKGGFAMAAAAFVAAPIGALVTNYVPVNLLLILFAAAVVVAAGRMVFISRQPEPETMLSMKNRAVIGGLVGAFAGFLAGLLGVGGGFIMAPLLMWMGYKTKQAAATSAFAVTFSSFSGFLGHMAVGHFNWLLTIILVIAILIGSQLGSQFMIHKAKPKWVKQLYAVVLLAIAVKLVVGVV
jgi:uncharacterized membrane protein YfcA